MICKHFGKCGGCSLNLSYEQQLTLKINKVEFLFNKKLDKIIPSPKQFYYRNRMDYVISKKENIIIGLKEKGKWWEVVDLEQCFLMSPYSNIILKTAKQFFNNKKISVWDLKKHKGLLRYLIMREGKNTKEFMLIVNTSNDYLNKGFTSNKKEFLSEEELKEKENFHNLLMELYDLLKENIEITSFIHGVNNTITDISYNFEINVLKGNPFIKEKLHNYYFFINSNSFFQPNPYTTELIIKELENFISNLNLNRLIDLFSGEGTFSIPFNKYFSEIIAVEINKESLDLYKKNLEFNKINNKKFSLINKPVEKLNFDIDKEDLLIVDPPRNGLHKKAINWLKKQKNKYFIYISCNPETQYRDLELLKPYFKLNKLFLIDQFPNTNHIETIAFLERIK